MFVYLCVGLLPAATDVSSDEKSYRALAIGLSIPVLYFGRHIRDRHCMKPAVRDQRGKITKRGDLVPLHIDYFHERVALMVVIVLGESVLGIILPDLTQSAEFLATAGFASLLISCIQYLYFEVDNLRFAKHCLRTKALGKWYCHLHRACFWIHGHQLLMVTMLIFGVGIKLSLVYNNSFKTKYRMLLTGSCAVTLVLSFGLHTLHRLPTSFKCGIFPRMVVRVVVSAIVVGLGAIPKDDLPAWALMGLISGMTVTLVMFEFYASRIKLVHTDHDQHGMSVEKPAA